MELLYGSFRLFAAVCANRWPRFLHARFVSVPQRWLVFSFALSSSCAFESTSNREKGCTCTLPVVDSLLPLPAILLSCVLVAGGLSPSISYVDQVRCLDRFQDIHEAGAFADLLWSDPFENEDRLGWVENNRGVGYLFGKDVVEKFNHLNDVSNKD